MRTSGTGSPEKRPPWGFTLFELLVVLFVLGLFAGVLAMRIEGALLGGDLRLTSRVIIGEISRLRGKAAYTHQEQSIILNLDENTLEPSDARMPEGILRDSVLLKDEEKTKVIRLPKGINLVDVVLPGVGKAQEGEARMRFYPNGTVDGALIHVANERDERYTLEVYPLTGDVVIHDKYIDRKMGF